MSDASPDSSVSSAPASPSRDPSESPPTLDRALLALQATYLSDPTPSRRLAVSVAARDLASEVEVLARCKPKTLMEASLALLREQRETNRLLSLLLA
ncbi:hypothetical protein VE02_09575 [Pseudogymnoascus sp. 03VT05]|nr:hypothetical protein VE02_09575 [Pseudogymnoascus sp. 03VT05]